MVADGGDRVQLADTVGLGRLGPDGIVIYERLLPAIAGSVPRIRHELESALLFCALDAGRRSDIGLFVTEAASNAVRHAYAVEPGPLYALAGVDDECFGLLISDWGRGLPPDGRDPEASASVTTPAGAGWGMALMTQLADAVSFESDRSGTDVEGSFALAGGAGVAGPSLDVRAAGGQMLREYLRVLHDRNDALHQDTAAMIAEARQAVAHSRRRRQARHQLH